MSTQNPIRSFRRDRRRDQLFVVVPTVVAVVLSVAFVAMSLGDSGASGAAVASPTEGSVDDSIFWVASGAVIAAGAALSNWRLPRMRRSISFIAGVAVLAAVVLASVS